MYFYTFEVKVSVTYVGFVKLAAAFKVDIYRRVFACLRKLCKGDCLTVSACHAK